MLENVDQNRRSFLKVSGAATGGLIIAFYVPTSFTKALAKAGVEKITYPPNAFIQIAPDNAITITINRLEMGQGPFTSMAQLIAEELECDFKNIKAVSAGVNPVYNAPGRPMQMTGGSSSLSGSWEQYRTIGASMREMLKSAAAAKWGVSASEIKAENGFMVHPKKGKISYGELAEAASQLPIPQDIKLKESKNFTVIGQSKQRVDAVDKSTGKAIFGMDVKIPGMLYASVARPHVQGSKIKSMNTAAAKKIKGVVDVVKFEDRVAVLAKNTFAATKGREALDVKWDNSANKNLSTRAIMEDFKKQASSGKGVIAEEKGSAAQENKKAKRTLNFEYEFPFLSHASMEPLNCTMQFDGKTAELWSGFQMPGLDQQAAAKVLGIKPEKIKFNTVYAGGSFGRRACKNSDYVVEACQLAKKIKKPFKITWSREDDMHGGYYRPMNLHKVSLGLDEKNQLLGWDHKIVGHTVMGSSPMDSWLPPTGVEATVTEGITESAYNLAHFRCEQIKVKTPVTTLWWRSVGHTHTAFVMETLMDELSEESKQDPLEYRRKLLEKAPRHLAVLDLLKKQTGWGSKKPPKGRAWGLALHESFNTVVGQVAEVSLDSAGQIKVHKVWNAVHCGKVVNPEGAKTQIEGGIVYGLSAALYGQISIEAGVVQQNNFHDYQVMRINEMPEVFVEFVKTEDAPTGLGEPGVPPIAPAVANAVYRLNKKRLRLLPFSREMQA